LIIRRVETVAVEIPYEAPVGPYAGRGRSTSGARALITRVETSDGSIGWGEGHGEFTADPQDVLEGRQAADIGPAVEVMRAAGISAGALSGVEMALWDLLGKKAGVGVCRLLGGVVRSEIDFCGCMGIKAPEESSQTAQEYIDRWGFRFIKTKAGEDPEQDIAIAEALMSAVGTRAAVRPDANAGYDVATAEWVLSKLDEMGVPFYEDPCAPDEVEALARFRKGTGIRILVNMGVSSPASVVQLLVNGAADYLMPDTVSAGGILGVVQVAAAASAFDVHCLMHCSHDLGLKTAAVLHVAAATPTFSGPNDTCYHGLTDDILTRPFQISEGRISLPDGPGLGVEVDSAKLDRYAI